MGTYKYDQWRNIQHNLFLVYYREDEEEVGEVDKNASRIPERSAELDPCWTQGRIEVRQGVPVQHKQPSEASCFWFWEHFHFWPENLLAAHTAKIFKAVTSDPNATEDTKDPVGDAEQDEDDLDKVQNRLFSSSILTEDRVANHQVAEVCYSHRDQPIPCRVT